MREGAGFLGAHTASRKAYLGRPPASSIRESEPRAQEDERAWNLMEVARPKQTSFKGIFSSGKSWRPLAFPRRILATRRRLLTIPRRLPSSPWRIFSRLANSYHTRRFKPTSLIPSRHVRSNSHFCPFITSTSSPRAHPSCPSFHHTLGHSPGTPKRASTGL
jgi:hypothetical protein